ncbi:MAG TPA: hypothetical protein VF044_04015 [Actinomycetota bacterium]
MTGTRRLGARATGGDDRRSAPWKRRLVLLVVGAVALWPFAHRVAVARLDVNPWKLAGWAMYATPTPPILVAIFRPVPGGWALVDRLALPPAARKVLDRFERERHAIGDLRTPDDVARAVLAARRDLAEIAVVVERKRLDPATARMTSRKARYHYDRVGRRRDRTGGPVAGHDAER